MHAIRFVFLVIAGLLLASGAHADPTVVGTTHFNSSVSPSSTVTIVSASANTSGVSLKTAILAMTGVGTTELQLSDGTIFFIISNGNSSAAIVTGNLPYPIYLPPGVGLGASTTVTGSSVWVTYDTP